MPTIDLNCDLGEEPKSWERDLKMLALVTSANVACGGHAGDPRSMRRAVRAAHRLGVAVGAHPSYPDREHFGRRDLDFPSGELSESLGTQLKTLCEIAAQENVAVCHVKPHGALYNRAAWDVDVARLVGEAVARVDRRLILFGLAGSRGLEVWREMGFACAPEAFADRRYEADGSLRGRNHADALLTDSRAAAEQAVGIARDGWALAASGERVAIQAASLCLHSDTAGAREIASAVRQALLDAGCDLRAIPVQRVF